MYAPRIPKPEENNKTPRRAENADVAKAPNIQRALENPQNLTPDAIHHLQSTHGNQFVNNLTRPIQAKMEITPAGDKYENEADAVADNVVTQLQRQEEEEEMMQGKRIQREEMPEEEEMQAQRLQRMEEEEEMMQGKRIQRMEEEELMQGKRLQREEMPEEEEIMAQRIQRMEDEELMQGKRLQREDLTDGGPVSSDVESQIENARGGGDPLDRQTLQRMEGAMGANFSGVRVHNDAQSSSLNDAVQARAFTTGQDIFFRSGEYKPESEDGQRLLAHELTHVMQQNPDVKEE